MKPNMTCQISPEERTYVRELARKQAGYAALPVMEQRRKMWYALNDGQTGAVAPVVVETRSFDRDFLPERVFRCASPAGRDIERQLLRNIRNHELIDDDKVVPDSFQMEWFVEIDELGVRIERQTLRILRGSRPPTASSIRSAT